MDQPFIILEHPADMGIEARGKTLPQAFANVAVGLMSIILDLSTVSAADSKSLTVTGADREQLLVRFLTEILYQYDGVGFATKEVTINALDDSSLDATLRGEPLDPSRHVTLLDVKAVTYHQLMIDDEGDAAVVRVFLDI